MVQIGYSTQSLTLLCTYYNIICTTEAIEIKDRDGQSTLVLLVSIGPGENKESTATLHLRPGSKLNHDLVIVSRAISQDRLTDSTT